MDDCKRNSAFEENQYLLAGCVKRNYPLIMALQIEVEDVVQDLSLRMCRSIERYDGSRCRSLKLFLYHELQNEILDIRRRHKPHGVVGVPRDKRLDVVYIDHPREDGSYLELPIEEDFDVSSHDIVRLLPEDERAVLIRKMNGEPIRKKIERDLLIRARIRLIEYFSERTPEYA